MAVYLGNTAVNTLAFGSSNLSAFYLGENKLWPTISAQSGSFLVIGQFTAFENNYATSRIQYLTNNLSASTGFKSGSGLNDGIGIVAVPNATDDTFFIGGAFTQFDLTQSVGLVKVKANGLMDTSFLVGSGCNNGSGQAIYSIIPLANGKVYIGGNFSEWQGQYTYDDGLTPISYFCRLNADGTLDQSFKPSSYSSSLNGTVYSIATQSDGKFVLGGMFRRFDDTQVGSVVRINPDYTLDRTFYTGSGTVNNPGIYGNWVNTVQVQYDGKIVVGGNWSTVYDETISRYMVRLNTDGTIDTTFYASGSIQTTGATPRVPTIIVEPSGSTYGYFIGHNAFNYILNGTTYNGCYLMRMFEDGTVDTSYFGWGNIYSTEIESMTDLGTEIIVTGQSSWISGSVDYGKVLKVSKYGAKPYPLTKPASSNQFNQMPRYVMKFKDSL